MALNQKLEEILTTNTQFQLKINQLERQLNSVTNFLKQQFGDEFVSSADKDFIANLPSRPSADADDRAESDVIKIPSLSSKCKHNCYTAMEQNLIRITRDHIIKVDVNGDDVESVETTSCYLENDEDPLGVTFRKMSSILSTDQEEDPSAGDLSLVSNGIEEGAVVVSDGKDRAEDDPDWNPAIKPVTRAFKPKRNKKAGIACQCDWPGCNKSFKEKRMASRHKSIHSGEKPYVCDWPNCTQKFPKSYTLKIHKIRHTGEKKRNAADAIVKVELDPLELEQMSPGSTTDSELIDPFADFPTTTDDGSINSRLQRNSHRLTSDDQPFVCDWPKCTKRYRHGTSLIIHKRIHTGEKPYVCGWQDCKQRFARQDCLIIHKRIHTGEKPYICDWEACGRQFGQKSTLVTHTKSHTRETTATAQIDNGNIDRQQSSSLQYKKILANSRHKPFACDWPKCTKRFAKHSYLTEHKRTHTGEKPFACNWKKCKRRFNNHGNLIAHIRIHTGEKPFICDTVGCGKQFAQRGNLLTHQQKYHHS